MNIFADFNARIIKAVEVLDLKDKDGVSPDLSRIAVEPPRDASHGDLATNAAMVLAKPTGQNPRALAERLAEALRADADVAAAEVAGPGFVNLRLKDGFWQAHLTALLGEGRNYGRSTVGGGRKANVEYVSANPTGPMHVGHCRGAVVGDTLANLMAFAGYDVTKEYVINDAGAQIDVLGRSVMLRYREALGEAVGEIPAGLYPGDYLIPVGQALAKEFDDRLLQMPEDEALAIVKDRTIDAMMAMIREDLALLNVHHDVFFSERTLHADNAKKIRSAINDLTLKGHIYKGKLPPPKGEKPDDWEDREQTLFRSTAVGDDLDRPLVKSDGTFTYFAADVAYLKDKVDRGFVDLIYVLGADHGGYVKRLEALARAIVGRRGEAYRAALPVGEAVSRRRAGAHVEAVGRFRDAARSGGGGRARPDPLHDALSQERRAARFRLCQGDRAVEGQSGVLRAVRLGAVPFGVPAGERATGRSQFRPQPAGGGGDVACRRGRDRADQETGGISTADRVRSPCARAASAGILPLRSGVQLPRALEPGHR